MSAVAPRMVPCCQELTSMASSGQMQIGPLVGRPQGKTSWENLKIAWPRTPSFKKNLRRLPFCIAKIMDEAIMCLRVSFSGSQNYQSNTYSWPPSTHSQLYSKYRCGQVTFPFPPVYLVMNSNAELPVHHTSSSELISAISVLAVVSTSPVNKATISLLYSTWHWVNGATSVLLALVCIIYAAVQTCLVFCRHKARGSAFPETVTA